MMVMSLTKIGYDGQCLTEHWVNYLGLTSVLVGTLVAICVGMATDRIRGKMKLTILSLLVAGLTIHIIIFFIYAWTIWFSACFGFDLDRNRMHSYGTKVPKLANFAHIWSGVGWVAHKIPLNIFCNVN